MSTEKLAALLRMQAMEQAQLAEGVYTEWQPIRENETKLLSPYSGDYEKAPDHIKNEVIKKREAFFAEWGSEGRLTALLYERHAKQRKDLIEREAKVQKIKDRLTRNPDHDQGR